MKSKIILAVAVFAFVAGCERHASTQRDPASPEVTVPNGNTPANAPRAPMNDGLRKGAWNHGNDVLWVWLNPEQFVVSDDQMLDDGAIRVKFGWWRGIQGSFSITGRRLDAPAPPLRSEIPSVDSYGDLGFLPSSLIFPADGYWEITGHMNDQTLTFVVHVTRKVS